MEKPAQHQHEIHDLINKRWSPRAFSAREVEPEKLKILLEAARWAASSYNQQPWSFMVATKRNLGEYERLLGCLVKSNSVWASQAPVLMLSIAKLNFDANGKSNRHAYHDVGQAAFSLALQATGLGLAAHQMAGFDIERARAEFEIPEGYDPVAAIAVGYPGDPETLPEKLKEMELAPRTRRELKEFVFSGKWGNPGFGE